MKVLILSSELWPVFSGGLGVAVYELARNLSKMGESVTVAIPKLGWKGKLDAEVVEAPLSAGYSVYFYKGEPVLDWESMKSIYAFNFALFRSCSGKRPDVVHANDWMTVPAAVMFREAGIPVIFHVHSTEYDRTNNNPREWVLELEKLGAERADLVVANSHRTREQLVSLYGIPPEKVTVIYNGIDLRKFRKALGRPVRKPGDRVVLFVGRLTIQKGVWHLLHAARMVVNKDPRVKFIIVGEGPDMPFLIKTAIELGLERNVVFTGRLDDDGLMAAYRFSDIFVMPSVSEPFGIVALEAMASGTPLIISKTAGVGEVLEHCFKVDYWDTQLMASRILEVLNYGSLRRTMLGNGAREVRQLSWENMARQFAKAYRRVAR